MSNIVTSLSTFFHSKEVEFLMSTPLKSGNIFTSKFFENVFYSSWATLIAGVPLIFAFGASRNSPLVFYPLSLLSLLIFLVIPASIGILLLILIIRFFPRIKKGRVFFLIIGLIIFLGIIFLFGKPSVFKIPLTTELSDLDRYLETLGTYSSPYLPNSWLASSIFALSKIPSDQSFQSEFLFSFLLLLSTGIFFALLALGIGQKVYHPLWLYRNSESRSRDHESRIHQSEIQNWNIPRSPVLGLIWKDLKLFLRDPTQWTQAIILLSLLMVYVISLHRTPIYFKDPFWRTLVSFINLGFTGYVFATLSIRFTYPTISLEGYSFWVLRSSPLSIRKLFLGKLLVNLLIGILLIQTLVILSNILLDVGFVMSLLSSIAVLFFAFSLVSISMGFGAMFPDMKERNPSKIASGPGGLLTALVSLTYIAISATILAWPAYVHLLDPLSFRPHKVKAILISGGAFLLLNLITTLVPLRLGIRALERREV
jgi:ABC-2 type transport system permease protein